MAKESKNGKGSKVENGRDKAENFKRLASKRTKVVLKGIEVLGRLSNKANYEYTPAQIDTIVGAINAKLQAMVKLYKSGGEVGGEEFTL
jgi:hypothetical protein